MKIIRNALLLQIVTSFLIAGLGCGDDKNVPPTSGLDPSLQVTSLSDGDLMTLCQWSTSYLGGPGTTRACNLRVDSVENCVETYNDKTCSLSVEQFEDCTHKADEDPCSAFGSSECSPLVSCVL